VECREGFLTLIPALPKMGVVALPTESSLVPPLHQISVGHFPGVDGLRFCIPVTIRAPLLASSIVRPFHDRRGRGDTLLCPEVIRVLE
jgi:hypothetical protein